VPKIRKTDPAIESKILKSENILRFLRKKQYRSGLRFSRKLVNHPSPPYQVGELLPCPPLKTGEGAFAFLL
jgi:hypothetical protein